MATKRILSPLVAALLAELTDADLDALAERLVPHLARRLSEPRPAAGWLRGAAAIADYIAAPVSRVYALTSAGRIPVERDGSALIARRAELDAWVREGGARRP